MRFWVTYRAPSDTFNTCSCRPSSSPVLCVADHWPSSVSSVSSGTTTAIVATDIVTIIIILMYCIVSNQMGFWAPMKLLRSACGLTDSECMHIPTEGPYTLRVQLHCNNNNKIVINGHFFVSGISIYFCIVCYVEFVLLQIQRITYYLLCDFNGHSFLASSSCPSVMWIRCDVPRLVHYVFDINYNVFTVLYG